MGSRYESLGPAFGGDVLGRMILTAGFLRCPSSENCREVALGCISYSLMGQARNITMAKCETTHWTLDCGEGSGCYLVEYSDTGEVAGWGCNSNPVTARPKKGEGESSFIDMERPMHFCCTEMTRAGLAHALDDLVPQNLDIPKGRFREKISHCSEGKMREILAALGFSSESTV